MDSSQAQCNGYHNAGDIRKVFSSTVKETDTNANALHPTTEPMTPGFMMVTIVVQQMFCALSVTV